MIAVATGVVASQGRLAVQGRSASTATMNEQSRETAVPPKGERHRLTVLFSDLVGSTVLGREMESEHFSELLGKLREIWHQAAVKHGGHVIRTQGDGALAIFGYPRSGEDDGRRAAEYCEQALRRAQCPPLTEPAKRRDIARNRETRPATSEA
jgi:class 3 adenylate cyclase